MEAAGLPREHVEDCKRCTQGPRDGVCGAQRSAGWASSPRKVGLKEVRAARRVPAISSLNVHMAVESWPDS